MNDKTGGDRMDVNQAHGLPEAMAETANPPYHAPLAAARSWLAATFHGLTWGRFGLFCLALLFINLHQGVTVYQIVNGTDAMQRMLAPVRGFAYVLVEFLPALLLVVAVENRGPRVPRRRIAWLVGALLAGHTIGMFLWWWLGPLTYWGEPASKVPPSIRMTDTIAKLRLYSGRALWFFVYSATALAVYYFLKEGRDAATALHREEFRHEEVERENAEARLQVMQAQIEPHFLFNALASVRRLYQTDRTSGRDMLQHLTRYLTASLPSMRESTSTLERELALALAYLGVQKIRMESRLEFAVDVPTHLRSIVIPPMMIATLVENAVIHGLSPLPNGGHIRISARDAEGKLVIEVADDGRGLQESWGGGVGLANIRARLNSAYGAEAQLTLGDRPGRGAIARIELPLPRLAEAA